MPKKVKKLIRSEHWHGPDSLLATLTPQKCKNTLCQCEECKNANGYEICYDLSTDNKHFGKNNCAKLYGESLYPLATFDI